MSHLGNRLSALVDGELSAEESDRVHAHLARCAACRAEARELRALKQRVRGLGEVAPDDALTARLIRIAEPGAPVPPRRRARRLTTRVRPGFRTLPRASTGPGPGRGPARPGPHRHRGRYLALGVVSCVFAGLSVTAFSMGGTDDNPGPRVTPPVQLYSVQHAITTGQVPLGGGSASAPSPVFTGTSALP
ncbi:MAG TPA: zf-HC2 domain-containing protein [Streptosporangiaceae bacterium]|nr:zf-HC2 domain-containing protein [Streptosporangiaceae bacterium]